MEIKVPLELTEEQTSLVDMHSVLNVLNVINYELILISEKLGDCPPLLELMDKVADAGRMLANPDQALQLIRGIDDLIKSIEEALDTAIGAAPAGFNDELTEHRKNLKTIYAIIRVRAGEIMARRESPDEWVEHRVKDLKSKFVAFLSAVEKNSHGRYRIVQNVAAQGDTDYLLQFEISSDLGDTLRMPIVFQDVMRDLLANARKYTNPGGSIQGGLHCDQEGLRFLVQDNGIGIPPDSIEQVVLFGKRSTNVSNRPTRGGGFGLTKAYYITRRHGGRMWIDSSTGEDGKQGTRIEIRLPHP